MKNISPIDEAELTQQMRSMYRQIGLQGSLQCLYELLKGAEILVNVIKEEQANDK